MRPRLAWLHLQNGVKIAVMLGLGFLDVDLRQLLLHRLLLAVDLQDLLPNLLVALFLFIFLLGLPLALSRLHVISGEGTFHVHEIPSLVLAVTYIELGHGGGLHPPDGFLPQLDLLGILLAISARAALIILDVQNGVLLNVMGG